MCNNRFFESLDYNVKQKSKLSAKQYLVYSYLVSISKVNDLKTTFVNKKSLVIKEACSFLKISQPTWRTAIKKLISESYICDKGNFYEIKLPQLRTTLPTQIIKFLVNVGIQTGCGEIVAVYSTIYKYWEFCKRNNEFCEITISQLSSLFSERRDLKTLEKYRGILKIFKDYGLVDFEEIKCQVKGINYFAYRIKGF